MPDAPTSLEQQQGPVIPVKAQANVYTVLLIIAVIALCVAIGVVIWKLTTEPPTGYGLPIKHIFKPSTPLPGS